MEDFSPSSQEAVAATQRDAATETGQHSGKKRFIEYLSEGLMIFIAVVMGFLAENVRENIGNHEKEKEYIKSYLVNLEEDSAKLNDAIEKNNQKISYLDSLLSLSSKDISAPVHRVNLYRYFYYTGLYWEFMNNDATFLQLINSGGLRIIKKGHAADSIAEYAVSLKSTYAIQQVYAQSTSATLDIGHQIFDFTVLNDTAYYANGDFKNRFIPFISEDRQKIKILFNKILFEKITSRAYVNNLEDLRSVLSGLIVYLKKEYPE